jgi:hypothetical protein
MSIQDPQDENDLADLQDVHFATIEEKKRLWFRDALINSLFMTAWYVPEIVQWTIHFLLS